MNCKDLSKCCFYCFGTAINENNLNIYSKSSISFILMIYWNFVMSLVPLNVYWFVAALNIKWQTTLSLTSRTYLYNTWPRTTHNYMITRPCANDWPSAITNIPTFKQMRTLLLYIIYTINVSHVDFTLHVCRHFFYNVFILFLPLISSQIIMITSWMRCGCQQCEYESF